ncbi:hypothetical protein [Tsukamurella sp. 1534]|uniref:hypothetical protein n=1 Tax=Tsukamurella sp. 1534 TaxID=1151061 RepID=UPI0002D5A0A7|nr:hypothetical protein [Tsukamurella sp. 1534]
MEPSALERAIARLAASFSEVTEGDLALPARADGATVGDLYRRAVERSAAVAGLDPALAGPAAPADDLYGGGYDVAYRRVARAAARATRAADAEALERDTAAWARDVDRALGLEDV